jgi:hypothetical protein
MNAALMLLLFRMGPSEVVPGGIGPITAVNKARLALGVKTKDRLRIGVKQKDRLGRP